MTTSEFISWFQGYLDAMEDAEITQQKWNKLKNKFNSFVSSNQPKKVEIDEDGDGKMDGYDLDGDGKIDEYFAHRQCEHVWGDSDNDGELECLKCGLLKDLVD
jgi:hypothetical protein